MNFFERKLSSDKDYEVLISYLEEADWFNKSCYVAWLSGATDGWPYAIFPDRESAVHWVKENQHNPEPAIIEEIDFVKLCSMVTGVGEY